MNTTAAALVLGLGLTSTSALFLQVAQPAAQAPTQSAGQKPAVQQIPSLPIGVATGAVEITHGPVVENVTDTTAEIAWSTNVNAGTALQYGADPSHLDQTAGMPWGGLTHRVSIKNLKPNTTYYFRAASGQGQGTGTQAQTAQLTFQTKPAGASAEAKSDVK